MDLSLPAFLLSIFKFIPLGQVIDKNRFICIIYKHNDEEKAAPREHSPDPSGPDYPYPWCLRFLSRLRGNGIPSGSASRHPANSVSWGQDGPKANVVVGVVRPIVVAIGGSAVVGVVVPATAPIHAVRALWTEPDASMLAHTDRWRDDLHVVRHHVVHSQPCNRKYLPLIRPRFRFDRQTLANRIHANVGQFLRVMFTRPHLRVPEIALPELEPRCGRDGARPSKPSPWRDDLRVVRFRVVRISGRDKARPSKPSPWRDDRRVVHLHVVRWRDDLRVVLIPGRDGARPSILARPSRPLRRDQTFPKCNPLPQTRRRHATGGAEEMDVIRHDHVLPDPPEVGRLPHFTAKPVSRFAGQHWQTILRAYTHLHDHRSVVSRERRMMRGMVAVQIGGIGHGLSRSAQRRTLHMLSLVTVRTEADPPHVISCHGPHEDGPSTCYFLFRSARRRTLHKHLHFQISMGLCPMPHVSPRCFLACVSVQPFAPLNPAPRGTARPDTLAGSLLTWGQDGPNANVVRGVDRPKAAANGGPAAAGAAAPATAPKHAARAI